MMYLSRLLVQNYRSIKTLDLNFTKGKNIIVGKNNAGKSNIIKAIDLLLGENSPTRNKSDNITDTDFFQGDITKNIFIWLEITRETNTSGQLEPLNFTEVESSAIAKVVTQEGSSPIRKYGIDVGDFDESVISNIFYFSTDEGEAILSNSGNVYKKHWIGGKTYCKASFDDEFSGVQKIALAFIAKKENGKIIKYCSFLTQKDGDLREVFINGNTLRTIFIQSAIIPSFRDPKDQLRINNWSWYGKLLKNYIDSENTDLLAAFDQVKTVSNQIFSSLKSAIDSSSIDTAFPSTKISFQFNPDVRQDIYKSALIYVDDGFNSKLEDKGSGIQSAVIIGLFDFYIRNVAHSGGSLLALEEPELYLHPHGRRTIAYKLDSFVNGGSSNQVIITTHSSEFITSVSDLLNIIVARKLEDGSGTQTKNICFDTPKRKQILIKRQNAEMFFADIVILTEGADKYILEEIAKEYGNQTSGLSKNWLNDYNISIINCGGKTELRKYVDVLNELDITNFILADFDFLRDGLNDYFSKLLFEKTKIDELNALKSKIATSGVTGEYKNLKHITDSGLQDNILHYIDSLQNDKIFILKGELEDYYIISPSLDKEGGVIETVSKVIEEQSSISTYVNIDDFEKLLTKIVSTLNISLGSHKDPVNNITPGETKAEKDLIIDNNTVEELF